MNDQQIQILLNKGGDFITETTRQLAAHAYAESVLQAALCLIFAILARLVFTNKTMCEDDNATPLRVIFTGVFILIAIVFFACAVDNVIAACFSPNSLLLDRLQAK